MLLGNPHDKERQREKELFRQGLRPDTQSPSSIASIIVWILLAIGLGVFVTLWPS